VTVKGNKVENGSFEQPDDGGDAPAAWQGQSTGAGTTSWSEGSGNDPETEEGHAATVSGTGGNAATAGVPTWTSAPIAVSPGEVLTLTADVKTSSASSAPTVGLAYLGTAGEVLSKVTVLTAPLTTDGFRALEKTVTVPAGVTSVRIVLAGFSATDLRTKGTVTFDNIGLYGE
jgi:hypothetical protein